MGTLLQMSVQGTCQESVEKAKEVALDTIQQWEERLSVFRGESDLYRLNQGLLAEADLSSSTREALKLARHYHDETQGAFNPQLQGQWDLGAFGKGFALDQAQMRLVAFSDIFSFRMDFGGQLLFWDREDHVSEIVVIEIPGWGRDELPEFWMKRRGSISTSAPFEKGGHILDPRTLKPMNARRSVTVIAPSAAQADAWSTALFVLGPEEGLRRVAKFPQLEAFFVEWANQRPHIWMSPLWPQNTARHTGIGTIHRP